MAETADPSATQNGQKPTTSSDSDDSSDVFSTLGSWEDFATENKVKVCKTTRRKIRRLQDQDSDDSEEENRPPPSICNVPLVSNPFCIRNTITSGDGPGSGIKINIKRVCFNPTITFHYF